MTLGREAKRNTADSAWEPRLTGSSMADPLFILELGGLDLIHGSDTESLHDLRHSDTMVMNTAQVSRQID